MQNMVIASTSTLPDSDYLQYLSPELELLFSGCDEILFIPYARPSGISHDGYTQKAMSAFAKISINVRGIHEFENPEKAVLSARGIFTGGGNTFLLVSQLYKFNLIATLKHVLNVAIRLNL